MKLLALVLLLVSFPVMAGNMVARDAAGNSVTLGDAQCTTSVWMKEWKTATVIFEGKTYQACWKLQRGEIVVLDAGGDVFLLPPYAFKQETGV